MRWIGLAAAALALLLATGMTRRRDRDHDGLPDGVEQSLLLQFAPRFQVSRDDCAGAPARFAPGVSTPTPVAADGTLYGQVTPLASSPGSRARLVEIHYYDLWSSDCGAHGHPLDDEHVAVLVSADSPDLATTTWQALDWYAAAHENTVCDVSQIARAASLDAVHTGPKIWISAGKHAAFLAPGRCRHGCGNDVCADSTPLASPRIVNLGEPHHPMNGAVWAASPRWGLEAKMSTSDFPPAARQQAPAQGIGLYEAGRHPMQGVIAISSHTADTLGDAQADTTGALGKAQTSSGGALSTGAHRTWRALQHATEGVGRFLHLESPGDSPPSPPAHPASPQS